MWVFFTSPSHINFKKLTLVRLLISVNGVLLSNRKKSDVQWKHEVYCEKQDGISQTQTTSDKRLKDGQKSLLLGFFHGKKQFSVVNCVLIMLQLRIKTQAKTVLTKKRRRTED